MRQLFEAKIKSVLLQLLLNDSYTLQKDAAVKQHKLGRDESGFVNNENQKLRDYAFDYFEFFCEFFTVRRNFF